MGRCGHPWRLEGLSGCLGSRVGGWRQQVMGTAPEQAVLGKRSPRELGYGKCSGQGLQDSRGRVAMWGGGVRARDRGGVSRAQGREEEEDPTAESKQKRGPGMTGGVTGDDKGQNTEVSPHAGGWDGSSRTPEQFDRGQWEVRKRTQVW